jgi:hypothetical protein
MHGRIRVDADQASAVPVRAGSREERPGPAADVEHRRGGHDERQVEVVVGGPGG